MLFLVSTLIVLYNNYYCRHVCLFFCLFIALYFNLSCIHNAITFLQQTAPPMCSVVTMVNVFLTASDVTITMTVETIVMKTDVVRL